MFNISCIYILERENRGQGQTEKESETGAECGAPQGA